jgi:cytochrome c oxidase subunit 3
VNRPAIDVSALPSIAFGTRAPLFWGVLGVVAIESTMYGLLIAAYFYVREQLFVHPDTPIQRSLLALASVNFAILLASAWPMHRCAAAALRADVPAMRKWLIASTALAAANVALKVVEFKKLPFRWDSHAQGSLDWMFLGLHFFHSASGVIENVVLIALLVHRKRVEKKHLTDIRVNALYWYFVVVAYVFIFAVVFVDPALFPHELR